MTIAEQDQLSGEHPELVVAGLEAERYVLVLFVSGACESSARAIANIREICDQHLIGRHHLTIVDVNQEPSMASRHHVLATPTLSVFDSTGTLVASNTGWGTGPNASQIPSISASVGAFALPANSADCALIANLTAGAYTVQISGVGNTTGVALAEVYEVSASGTARLANISTRAMVGTGGNILIPGFYISGTGTEELLVRADGPALTQYGVGGVLTQPTLSVYNASGALVATNTVWGTGANASQIPGLDASLGAFALATGSTDSAQIVSLAPGGYTIQVSGVSGTTGVALAEIYEVP